MASPCKNNRPAPALRTEAVLFFLGISVLFVGLAFLSPAQLDDLPPLCLWSRMLGGPCPACGTTHALCALVHGDLRQAVGYNWNVLAVAPLLVWLWCHQLVILFRSWPLPFRSPARSATTAEAPP